MNTKICIENATNKTYVMFNQSSQIICQIKANGYYYIRLFYNKNVECTYYCRSIDLDPYVTFFSFCLSNSGTITRIQNDPTLHLEVKDWNQHPPVDIDPLCIKTKNLLHNKLLITPSDDIFARADVPVIKYLFDLSYGS